MEIKAKQVAELRAKTGCGMMECKKALVEANGDDEAAIKLLRERGAAVAAKKAGRIAAEGLVDILRSDDGNTAAMIEVNSETDFVAKNASFKEFVENILKVVLRDRPADVDALLACKYSDEFDVEGAIKDKTFQIGEKITLRRFVIVNGLTSIYIHGIGQTGVIVLFEADDAAKNNPGFAEYSKNVALQVAAMNVLYVNKEAVPQSVLDEEKEILMTQIKNDPKTASKPEAIIKKMVDGRIGKYYTTNCLTEQEFFKEDGMTISQYTDKCAKEFGGKITIKAYWRYDKGEGLQKREDNFAEEIANLVK